jgi:hypothetical protein
MALLDEPVEVSAWRIALEQRLELLEELQSISIQLPDPERLQAPVLLRGHLNAGLGYAPLSLYRRAVAEARARLEEYLR